MATAMVILSVTGAKLSAPCERADAKLSASYGSADAKLSAPWERADAKLSASCGSADAQLSASCERADAKLSAPRHDIDTLMPAFVLPEHPMCYGVLRLTSVALGQLLGSNDVQASLRV